MDIDRQIPNYYVPTIEQYVPYYGNLVCDKDYQIVFIPKEHTLEATCAANFRNPTKIIVTCSTVDGRTWKAKNEATCSTNDMPK